MGGDPCNWNGRFLGKALAAMARYSWKIEQRTEGFNVRKGGRIMDDRIAHTLGYIRMLLVG